MRRKANAWFLLSLISFCLTGSLFYLHRLNRFDADKRATRPATDSAVRALARHVTKSLSELGKTPELSAHILFFNRVPKCGSEMLVLLAQLLQGPNNFRHFRLKGNEERSLNEEEQEELVRRVTDVVRDKAVPLTFDRHVYFVNFTYFNRQSPTYINLIRDPVDKLVSRFYYKRSTPDPESTAVAGDTIEECVISGNAECTFEEGKPYDLTIPYFCGQDRRCMLFNDRWALDRAKSNVERYFSVVGVLEELNATLEILEHKLPYFFRGIQHVYFKELYQPRHNENQKKPQVRSDIREYFKNVFISEYDFYEWIKSRLFQQLQILYGHNH